MENSILICFKLCFFGFGATTHLGRCPPLPPLLALLAPPSRYVGMHEREVAALQEQMKLADVKWANEMRHRSAEDHAKLRATIEQDVFRQFQAVQLEHGQMKSELRSVSDARARAARAARERRARAMSPESEDARSRSRSRSSASRAATNRSGCTRSSPTTPSSRRSAARCASSSSRSARWASS